MMNSMQAVKRIKLCNKPDSDRKNLRSVVERLRSLSAWGGCWFVVYIRRFINTFLNVCPFDYTAVAGSGKVEPVHQVNHTSWVAIITPTDRLKSVRNRCVIELFCGVVCVVLLTFLYSSNLIWSYCIKVFILFLISFLNVSIFVKSRISSIFS